MEIKSLKSLFLIAFITEMTIYSGVEQEIRNSASNDLHVSKCIVMTLKASLFRIAIHLNHYYTQHPCQTYDRQ